MARKITILFALALSGALPLCGQLTFQKQFDNVNGLFCLEQSPDGTFWLGTFLGKILRLDANGQWIGGHLLHKSDTAQALFIYDLEKTPDNGVWALYDRNNSSTALDDYLILARLGAGGTPLWQTSVHYGQVLHWANNRMVADPAGNTYVMSATFSTSSNPQPSRTIFVKVAPDGALLWSKTFRNQSVNSPRALARLYDGSLLSCGNSQVAAAPYGFLLRLSADGDILWSRRYDRFLFKAFVELPGGDWVFAATETGGLPQAACLLRMTPDGNILWAKRLIMPYALNWLPGLALTPASDILVFNYETPQNKPTADMICLSATGDFRWAKRYDACHNYGISAGMIARDGGIAGIRFRAGGGPLFLKTDISGNCADCPSEAVFVPLENTSDIPLPFQWQADDHTPPFPAATDFSPFTSGVHDFCEKEKPVTGISLFPDELCVYQPLTAVAEGPGKADIYRWFFPGGMPAQQSGSGTATGIRFEAPATATVTLATATGFCRDTFTAPLTVLPGPAPIDLGPDTTACGTDISITLDATSDGAENYMWQDGVADPVRLVNSAGVYIVRASAGACSVADTIRIGKLEGLTVNLPADTTICGVDTIWLDASTPNAERYAWNDGYAGARRPVTEQGYYAVTAFLDNCTASDFISVNLFPRPPVLPRDTFICDNEAITFTVGESLAGDIQWNGAPGLAEFTVEDSGWVRRVVTYHDCLFEDSVYVRRVACREGFAYYAPNVFSPNGDGANDDFEIFADALEVLVFQVFDRWGNLVFETRNGASARWNGTTRGRSLQPGVYSWLARVRQRGREGWISGDVLLLR